MKIRHVLITAILALSSSIAVAGRVQPAEVIIDLDNMFAQGDMWTARTADNDVELIGCGVRRFDDGIDVFSFGFCQARDANDGFVVCFTDSEVLLAAIEGTSDYSFLTFSWTGNDPDDFACTRIGFSTQSFYLPAHTTDDHDHGDDDSDDDDD